jgi:3-hydroxyisobutyrate dehydrogenase
VLPGAPEFARLMTHDSPVLAAMRAGTGWLDLTSNDPRVARASLDLSRERGLFGVGAPMGGGVEAAQSRALKFYVGASDRDLAAVLPVLESLGTPSVHPFIEHVGPAIEDGYLAKLLANQLWFGQVVAVTEALLLGQKLGLAPAALAGVLARSAGSRTFLEQHVQHLLDGDYLATFGLDRCVEELQILSSLAEATATPFALADLVKRLHEEALHRFGPVDGELLAARMLEEDAGATLRRDPTRDPA